MNKLGLLLTSDRHPHYVINIARAAYAKGLSVHIHMTGSAVRLLRHPVVAQLHDMVEISICSKPFAGSPFMGPDSNSPNTSMVPPEVMCGFIEACDRCVVL